MLIPNVRQRVTTWFQNEARKVVQGDGVVVATPQRNRQRHPTSDRAWTTKSVCGSIFADRVSDAQRALSEGEGKGINTYTPALGQVFGTLSPEEIAQCERLCKEWNEAAPSEDTQRKYVQFNHTWIRDA